MIFSKLTELGSHHHDSIYNISITHMISLTPVYS